MKRAFTASMFSIVLVVFAVACGSGGNVQQAETQRQFGVRMAKMNLWREAMFRFRRAAEIEPNNAMAHNNLAVAYEAIGDFDSAAKEYREALRLDRGNQHIQKNYSRFVEFTTRSKKREQKPAVAAADTTAAPTATGATSTGVTTTAPTTDTTATVPPPSTGALQ